MRFKHFTHIVFRKEMCPKSVGFNTFNCVNNVMGASKNYISVVPRFFPEAQLASKKPDLRCIFLFFVHFHAPVSFFNLFFRCWA